MARHYGASPLRRGLIGKRGVAVSGPAARRILGEARRAYRQGHCGRHDCLAKRQSRLPNPAL